MPVLLALGVVAGFEVGFEAEEAQEVVLGAVAEGVAALYLISAATAARFSCLNVCLSFLFSCSLRSRNLVNLINYSRCAVLCSVGLRPRLYSNVPDGDFALGGLCTVRCSVVVQ